MQRVFHTQSPISLTQSVLLCLVLRALCYVCARKAGTLWRVHVSEYMNAPKHRQVRGEEGIVAVEKRHHEAPAVLYAWSSYARARALVLVRLRVRMLAQQSASLFELSSMSYYSCASIWGAKCMCIHMACTSAPRATRARYPRARAGRRAGRRAGAREKERAGERERERAGERERERAGERERERAGEREREKE